MAKATQDEILLHNQIRIKDDLALAKLYDKYGESIIDALSRWSRKIAKKDKALILEAVNEAFWGYYRNPNTFDPSKNSLMRFLEIAADRDLKNILEREKKHTQKKQSSQNFESVENFCDGLQDNQQLSDSLIIQKETVEQIDRELANYFKNERDILLARMVLQEERETITFSKILGISELSKEEQAKEVKKHKDRIKKIIDRNNIELRIKSLLQ